MNIKKIIREEIDDESNEFKWIEDTQLGSLYVGALMLIDKNSFKEDGYLGGSPDNFILLKITETDEGDNRVYYITKDSNLSGENREDEGSTEFEWGLNLIKTGYWQPVLPGNDAHKAYYDTYMLKEGKNDFDWMGEREVFTFGEIYDLGMLDVGDTIWLSGEMQGDFNNQHYTLNSVKFVVENIIYPNRFLDTLLSSHDIGLKDTGWYTMDGIDAIQSDRELIVVGFKPVSDWDKRLSEQDEFDWIKDVGEGTVDLRDANPGDMLISQHGLVLTYIGPYPQMGKKWHKVKYPSGYGDYIDFGSDNNGDLLTTTGTRTDDGYVSVNNRLETDHDIVAIIKSKPINDQ